MKKKAIFIAIFSLLFGFIGCRMFQHFDKNDFDIIRNMYKQAVLESDFPVDKSKIVSSNDKNIYFRLAAGSSAYSKWQPASFDKNNYFTFGNIYGIFMNSISLYEVNYNVDFEKNEWYYFTKEKTELSEAEKVKLINFSREKLMKLNIKFSSEDLRKINNNTPECVIVSDEKKLFSVIWTLNGKRKLYFYSQKIDDKNLKAIKLVYQVKLEKKYDKFPLDEK